MPKITVTCPTCGAVYHAVAADPGCTRCLMAEHRDAQRAKRAATLALLRPDGLVTPTLDESWALLGMKRPT